MGFNTCAQNISEGGQIKIMNNIIIIIWSICQFNQSQQLQKPFHFIIQAAFTSPIWPPSPPKLSFPKKCEDIFLQIIRFLWEFVKKNGLDWFMGFSPPAAGPLFTYGLPTRQKESARLNQGGSVWLSTRRWRCLSGCVEEVNSKLRDCTEIKRDHL